jgi:hypothetical protein
VGLDEALFAPDETEARLMDALIPEEWRLRRPSTVRRVRIAPDYLTVRYGPCIARISHFPAVSFLSEG